MLPNWNLNPRYINQPIQLLGASLIGSVLLVGEFLFASTQSKNIWMEILFGLTAIAIFPIILYFIFKLQTKYRPQLQSDPYYHETKKWEQELLKGGELIKYNKQRKFNNGRN